MQDGEGSLYEAVAGLEARDVGAATRESAESALLDHLACVRHGISLPWVRTVVQTIAESSGHPRDGEVGASAAGVGERLVPADAALVNGTTAHGFDLDDTHLGTMTHPGAVVIPAVLAAAEPLGASGSDVVAAVIGGYEVMLRAAELVGLGFGERGFHATGQLGPLGAAAAVARLHHLPADELAGAVGLAASFGGGIKSFTAGQGTVKRLHAGRAAHAGILAVTLQRGGADGPRRALTGRFGVGETYAIDHRPDPAVLSRALGRRFAIEDVYFKRFAACGAVHGAMAAAETFGSVDLGAIGEIHVGTSRRALNQNSIPEPTDVMAAQYSTEYAVAVAVAGLAGDPDAFLAVDLPEGRALRELARRVRLHVDGRAEADYPLINRATVELRFVDGTSRSAEGQVAAATSRGWDTVAAKFRAIARRTMPARAITQLESAVRRLADGGEVREIFVAHALVTNDPISAP